jgi:hypothetical protein
MIASSQHGAWCVVRGAWCVERGAWCVVRGAWCVVRGCRGAWCCVAHHEKRDQERHIMGTEKAMPPSFIPLGM